MKKIYSLILIISIFGFSCSKNSDSPAPVPQDNTVNDADGNVYNTIKIGNQIWMKENLKTTKFNDGTPITKYSFAIHGNNWVNLNSPLALYRWADTSNLNGVHPGPLPKDYYGAMYNHLALQSGKLAPAGWRIPTEQDFRILKSYLTTNGYLDKEALAIKSSSGWLTSSGNGLDAIGFKGMPNGYVSAVGTSTFAEGVCTWATSNVNTTNNTRMLIQLYNKDTIIFVNNPIQIGAGVRCIKE